MAGQAHGAGSGKGHRIEIGAGGEHVRLVRDGQVPAESRRPVLLFETGLPVRCHLPAEDVRTELLTASDTRHRPPAWAVLFLRRRDRAELNGTGRREYFVSTA